MSKDAKKTSKQYHYRDCGLENIWIEGGYEEVDSPYGPGVAITDMDGLHRCIAECLVQKQGPLTGAEFRFLRTELDLSQLAMGALCGRGERTVRGWETEDEPVEEPANTIIRHVYQQRFNPSASFEELSKLIQQFQMVDKKLHELRFKIKAAEDGWKAVECKSDRKAA
jgi:putative transcriptional regulator